jgi:Ala-tRNA(Pro) deacylase
MTTNPVHELLDEHEIPYEVHEHPRAVDANRLAQSEDVTGWDVAKPVLLTAGDDLVMVVVPAAVHVDLDKAREVLDTGDVRLATEDEFVSRFPDFEAGAEPPFGTLYGIPVLLDETLRRRQRMVCRDGSHTTSITLSVDDYVDVVAPQVVDVATAPG